MFAGLVLLLIGVAIKRTQAMCFCTPGYGFPPQYLPYNYGGGGSWPPYYGGMSPYSFGYPYMSRGWSSPYAGYGGGYGALPYMRSKFTQQDSSDEGDSSADQSIAVPPQGRSGNREADPHVDKREQAGAPGGVKSRSGIMTAAGANPSQRRSQTQVHHSEQPQKSSSTLSTPSTSGTTKKVVSERIEETPLAPAARALADGEELPDDFDTPDNRFNYLQFTSTGQQDKAVARSGLLGPISQRASNLNIELV